MGEWISVRDRLPEIDQYVLVLTDEGVVQAHRTKGEWCEGEWYFLTLNAHGCGCCAGDPPVVTHWMALPESPEDVEELGKEEEDE